MYTNFNISQLSSTDQPVPELLFQIKPRPDSSTFYKYTRSWKHSIESYQRAARREYHLLLANHRQANHEIIINYLNEFFVAILLEQFSRIKEYLKQHAITAYHVAEITTDGFGHPVNRIHYHFLVDWHDSEHRLKTIFKDACQHAGLKLGTDFRIVHCPIHDRQTFEHKAKYILKYDNYANQAILFGLRIEINKIGKIGHWFINADGTKISKEKMWKSIVAGWYPPKQKTIRITVRFSAVIQISRNLTL